MNTARRHLVPLVALLGCGPTTINVTTTGEGEAGEASTTDISWGSTGLGGSASGHVDTTSHTGAESDSGTNGGTTTTGDGSSSSSSGEPPSECLPSECCPYEQPDGSYACFCNHVWSSPDACGCFDGQEGCECYGYEPSDLPCLAPPSDCVVVESAAGLSCVCFGEQVDPSECSCFDTQNGCECPEVSSPVPCSVPPTDPCDAVDTNSDGVLDACECDGVPSNPEACDCVPSPGMCLCDGADALPGLCPG